MHLIHFINGIQAIDAKFMHLLRFTRHQVITFCCRKVITFFLSLNITFTLAQFSKTGFLMLKKLMLFTVFTHSLLFT